MKILKVDLTNRQIHEEEFHQKDYGFFGGRGLIARFLTDYCDPTCDPLGPDNPLIFATGYFSGTHPVRIRRGRSASAVWQTS